MIFDVINDMKYDMMQTNDKWAFNHRMWFYYYIKKLRLSEMCFNFKLLVFLQNWIFPKIVWT